MNHEKYSESENAYNSMEWEGDEGMGACSGEDATSSFDTNAASVCAFSQVNASGYSGQKRKSSSSLPPAKISRKFWDGNRQHEDNSSLNKTNLHNNSEVASEFAIAPPILQMMQVEQRGISIQDHGDSLSSLLVKADIEHSKGDISTDFSNKISSSFDPNFSLGFTSSQPSTSGCTSRKSLPPARISGDIWSGNQHHEENSSLNKTNPHNNREMASGFPTAPPFPQMMQVEQRGISSGFTLSQPSTSGYTGRKSLPPARISGDIWSRNQHHEENSSLNETNPYNNREMASGFPTAPPIPQMMQVEQRGNSSQATSANTAAVFVNDDTSNSEKDNSTDFLPERNAVLDPNRTFRCVAENRKDREHIIRFLDVEVSSLGPPVEEVTQPSTGRYSLFHRKLELFTLTFELPEWYRNALRRHLQHHGIDEFLARRNYSQELPNALVHGCLICSLFHFSPNP